MNYVSNLNVFLACTLSLSVLSNCSGQTTRTVAPHRISLGNEQIDQIVKIATDKRVAIVGNHTSVLFADTPNPIVHLVDTLLVRAVDIVKVFAPEHGFRGDHANGDHINDDIDPKTNLPILSLHGKSRKPSKESLSEVDLIIFDIQDVGARFYTYLSTMLLVMEAAAESDVEVLVLDRPNPHGHHVDGPMLDPAFKSFVGWAPVPVIHGMTFGELAKMAVGEGWLEGDATPRLTVIKCGGYAHSDRYMLSIAPSPNLPTHISVELYPSLCFLEPTNVSIGRGTPTPFEIAGVPIGMIPNIPVANDALSFTPVSSPGASPYPKHENVDCVGENLKSTGETWWLDGPSWDLSILETYAHSFRNDDNEITGFFTSKGFFDKLAGTDQLRLCLEKGEDLEALKAIWDKDLIQFRMDRHPYLLYPIQRN